MTDEEIRTRAETIVGTFYDNPKFWHAALNNIIELATRARDEGKVDTRIPEIEQAMRADE